jgi:hypothetical protein
MKNTRLSFVLAFLAFGCAKPDIAIPERLSVDLAITQASAPANVARYAPIPVQLRVTGLNQCYQFSFFQVIQPNPLTYDIQAKGTMTNPDTNPVCAPQAYTKDTTVMLPTQFAGKHALRYFNGTVLFRVDTVMVN